MSFRAVLDLGNGYVMVDGVVVILYCLFFYFVGLCHGKYRTPKYLIAVMAALFYHTSVIELGASLITIGTPIAVSIGWLLGVNIRRSPVGLMEGVVYPGGRYLGRLVRRRVSAIAMRLRRWPKKVVFYDVAETGD